MGYPLSIMLSVLARITRGFLVFLYARENILIVGLFLELRAGLHDLPRLIPRLFASSTEFTPRGPPVPFMVTSKLVASEPLNDKAHGGINVLVTDVSQMEIGAIPGCRVANLR